MIAPPQDAQLEKLFPDKLTRETIRSLYNRKMDEVPAYSTSYTFHDSDWQLVKEANGHACFAQLGEYWGTLLKENKKPKYLRYRPQYDIGKGEALAKRWVELGFAIGLIEQSEINDSPYAVKQRGLQFDLEDNKLSFAKLYMSLCYLRWLRESPTLVQNVLDLVEKAGRDFWLSVVYCHAHWVYNTGHSILPFRCDPYHSQANKQARDLGWGLQLYLLCEKASSVYSQSFSEALAPYESGKFKNISGAINFHEKVVKPQNSFILKDRLMLLSSEVYPIVTCGSYDRAAVLAKQIEEQSKNVEFETYPGR